MRVRLGLLIALIVLALPACGGSDAKPGSAEQDGAKAGGAQGAIKVGALLPLSGGNAEAGTNMLHAARLAADDVNAAGGVLGRHIEIVPGDDGCSPEMATAAAGTLLGTGIVGIAGGYCSGATIPASAVTDVRGIPYIAMASNPALTDRGLRTVFRVYGRDDRQAVFAARFLAGPGAVKKLALLHDNSLYAKGLAELIRSANDDLKLGIQVVFFDAITPGQADYRAALTRIRTSGADTLYYTGYPGEAGLLLRQAKELRLPVRLMGGDGTNDPVVIKVAGAAAEGYVVTTAPLPQFLPSGEAFAQSYRQRFGEAPGPYAMYEYDMVRILADAIFRAGSTEPKDIVEALRTTHHEGLTGEIFFDEKGDRQTAVHVTAIVRNGEFRPYKRLDPRGEWIDG
jgi:ABC-type branched-subunit amino acid transport system substrate-binding protein